MLIARDGRLPDGRPYTMYDGSNLRWIGAYPCESGARPHDLGPAEVRPHGATGYARPIMAGCRACGGFVTVGWESGPVYYTDRAAWATYHGRPYDEEATP